MQSIEEASAAAESELLMAADAYFSRYDEAAYEDSRDSMYDEPDDFKPSSSADMDEDEQEPF